MQKIHTLFSQPSSLVQLKLFLVSGARDGGVAPCPSESKLHGFVEELEALDLLYSLKSGLGLVEDDEGLALCLHVRLGDDVDDVTILGKHGG